MITQACDRTPALLGCISLQSYQGQSKLWQVVVTIFFPASPFSPRRNVIAGVHSSLSSSSSHSSPRQLADRFFMGGGMASNFLSFASATCSFPGAVVEAFAASPQSPCRLVQVKDSCAAETIGGVGPSAGLEASLAQRSVCNQSELQRLISARC